MLDISTRRQLTENAGPTNFSYSKPTQKRKATEKRKSCSTKHQLIDDTIQTNLEMELIDKENLLIENSKSCQTEIAIRSVRSISTQTNASDISVIEENEDHIAVISQFSQTEIPSDNDISFCTEEEISSKEEEEVQSKNERPKGSAFIVYWSSLSILLQRCLICTVPAIITKVITTDSTICINLLCQENHKSIWQSQPMEKRFYLGNLRLSACMLFSSNTYRKLEKYSQILKIPWVLKSCYYDMLDHTLSVTNEVWKKKQSQIVSASKQRRLILSGDGHCDNPSHNAKYLTYSLFDQNLKKVIADSLTQVTEVEGVSNRMRKAGLIKVADEVKQKKLKVDQLTTDRHLQIKKYLREQEGSIDHQFGVWHFSKSMKTKLLKVSKKRIVKN